VSVPGTALIELKSLTDCNYRRTQIDFSLRCMFPVWSHWTATMTRRGRVLWTLRRLYKTLTYLMVIVALGYRLRYGREKTNETFRSLLAKPLGMLRGGLVA
jgi:hypothetical protein